MNKFYTVSQFSKLVNVSIKTLQKWDGKGILKAYRTPTDRRYYTHTQYLEYIGETKSSPTRMNVIYGRVSNRSQQDDLKNQIQFIVNHTIKNGISIGNIISDIGSGLNYKRPNWNNLLIECMEGKIDTIFISHKDRFIRFGFDWFETFLERFNVKIIILDNQITSPEEELIKDLVSIIHVFSCRIYGLRKYKKKILSCIEP